ncbi:MAG: ROK family protein [Chloroflexota bacterium]
MADGTCVVVDLGGTRVRVALADSSLALTGRREENTDHARSAAGTIDQIIRMAATSLSEASLGWEDIAAIGIASPGPLIASAGIVCSPPNLPGWGEVNLKAQLEARSGVPVSVVNDASGAALGEFHAGAGKGFLHLVYLTVSTGIGGGIVSDGRLLEGTLGMAGEIGHMTIDRCGPPCPCGSFGCLEILASGTSIARRFAEQLHLGRHSVLSTSPTTVMTADIVRAARAGDEMAQEVFHAAARDLGFGIVNVINLFNPEVVVVGGGVASAGDLLFGPVIEVVDQHAYPSTRKGVLIVPSALGEDAGLVGAAVRAQEHRASDR